MILHVELETCPYCGGKGEIIVNGTTPIKCENCQGTGQAIVKQPRDVEGN
jgi:DnaJ-class molecular chaperone